MITLTEIEDIVENWKVLNLDEMFDDLVPISLCLQAQIKFNENKDLSPQFKRISVPLIIRAFNESKAFKRNRFVNYFEDHDKQIAMFKTKFQETFFQTNNILENEAGSVADLASNIAKEIDSLFSDVMSEEIVFHGLGCLKDGTITLVFRR